MRPITEIQALRGPVSLVHLLLSQFVQPGDNTADATCGNGKDTLLMAELAGETGHVWAFDIQNAAIQRTSMRLNEAGLDSRVTLITESHEKLSEHICLPLKAIVFNLGWLPGGDRSIITRPETTLPAIDASLELLVSGGILAVTCYPGHNGGDSETDAVLNWSTGLPANRFHVWRMGQLNVSDNAPFCLVIQKAAIPDAS